jgi:alkanesulfonate monooxygenase SsuD/methylene tetrahydromethanopterin reductase-like flavin-dependent oxidoreductase (luciferase family)
VVATEAELAAERDFAKMLAEERAKEYSREGRDVAFSGAAASRRGAAFPDPIVGTPDQVLGALAPMFEKSPFTHLVLAILPHQLDLFAHEILPTLRSWGREPVKDRKKQ